MGTWVPLSLSRAVFIAYGGGIGGVFVLAEYETSKEALFEDFIFVCEISVRSL